MPVIPDELGHLSGAYWCIWSKCRKSFKTPSARRYATPNPVLQLDPVHLIIDEESISGRITNQSYVRLLDVQERLAGNGI